MVEVARRAGRTDLWLWVLEDNLLARHVYARLGLTWAGERRPTDSGGRERFERRLRLVL